MAYGDILTSIKGRRFGIGPNGELVLHKQLSGAETFELLGFSKVTTITSAQLLALNATPKEVLPAPGSGLAWVVRRWAARKAAGTAYAGIASGEDLTLKYTNGSGAQCAGAIETTGFLDQTTAQVRVAGQVGAAAGTPADVTPVANAAVVIQLLSGEITTGDTDLIVKVWADLIETVFTA